MNALHDWARRWGIPRDALADLARQFGALDAPLADDDPTMSEAAAQAQVRLEASRHGKRLWRNNVGAGYTEDGSFMRWGLANDSAALNKRIKSSDLVGISPRTIQPADVGKLIGQFLCREIKKPGWKYTGTEREQAQLAWITLINSLGGDAGFATGPGTL